MTSSEVRRTLLTMVAGALAALLIFSLGGIKMANASHEPANKAGAVGSDIDAVTEAEAVLTETMRVSSPEDLIIQVTAECSILTALTTNNDSANAFAFGSVRMWVTIDGTPVPVSGTPGEGADDTEDDDDVVGEVTFCNRAYERTVTDGEDPADGIDEESDYIRTRTANAFNWLAFDTGFIYDSPDNGNNIIEVTLWADYDTAAEGGEGTMAEAFVGSRTMIIEPTKVSNHEQI
jgi:hypothetical protein